MLWDKQVPSYLSTYPGATQHLLRGDCSDLLRPLLQSILDEKREIITQVSAHLQLQGQRDGAVRAATALLGEGGWVSCCWSLQTEIAPCTAPFPGNLRGRGAGEQSTLLACAAHPALEEARGGWLLWGERSWEQWGNPESASHVCACGTGASLGLAQNRVELGCGWALDPWCHVTWARGDWLGQDVLSHSLALPRGMPRDQHRMLLAGCMWHL